MAMNERARKQPELLRKGDRDRIRNGVVLRIRRATELTETKELFEREEES
jgi:hypothetical protein